MTSAPQGTYCLTATSRTPTGAACTATFANFADASGVVRPTQTVTVSPGLYQPSGPRGLVRDQENQLLYNQTDIRLETGEKGGIRNVANVGVSGTIEDYAITGASLPRTTGGALVILPQIDYRNPNTVLYRSDQLHGDGTVESRDDQSGGLCVRYAWSWAGTSN